MSPPCCLGFKERAQDVDELRAGLDYRPLLPEMISFTHCRLLVFLSLDFIQSFTLDTLIFSSLLRLSAINKQKKKQKKKGLLIVDILNKRRRREDRISRKTVRYFFLPSPFPQTHTHVFFKESRAESWPDSRAGFHVTETGANSSESTKELFAAQLFFFTDYR